MAMDASREMYILTECLECGFIWSTLSLANECSRIDKRRKEMRKQDEQNVNSHFRIDPIYLDSTEYPK